MATVHAGLQQSRYGDKIATKIVAAYEHSVSDATQVKPMYERLCKNFDQDRALSRDWRMDQLNAMLRMMEEGRTELQQAMFKDLHKSAHEANFSEIDFTISEIAHAIRHLDEWMAPHPVTPSALNTPGAGATIHDPMGVCLIMGAWNYPILLTLAPLVGSIAGGNCTVVKPGSYAPHCSHAMAKLIYKYLDRDCIVVCEGNRDVTDALLECDFDVMFYTGSGFVGKKVAAAAAKHLSRCILELGGKSPCIVEKSADLDLAASRLVWGSFLNSGQTCIRPDHLLVEASIADKFLQMCKDKIVEMYSKDVQSTEWFGRIINPTAFDRLKGIIDASRDKIIFGGKTDAADKFIEPTLLDYGTDRKAFMESPAMLDEIFGPIIPIYRFTDFERDVIQHVRTLPTGKPLALYLFSENPVIVENVKRRTTAGGMCVNDTLMHIANADLPFGGVGQSGMGAYHGFRSFECFTHTKAVLTKYSALDQSIFLKSALAVRYAPYTEGKIALIKLLSNPTVDTIHEFMSHPTTHKFLMAVFALLFARRLGFSITRN